MELSGIELRYLVNEIRRTVRTGYYVSNVYSITRNSVQIKLHHPTEPDLLLVISDKGIWLSKFKFDSIEHGTIVNKLRDEITRAKIDDIEQFGTERVVVLKFVLDAKVRYLVAEFFAGGNIILCDESMNILAILNPVEVRHRVLRVGRKYVYPPKRGTDPLDLKIEDLMEIRSSDLAIPRWIGRNIALPKKFVEEVVTSSSLDLNTKGRQLSEEDVGTLHEKLSGLVADICDGRHNPVLVRRDNIAVDASPVMLRSLESFEPATSYMEAIDAVLSTELKSAGESIRTSEVETKIGELERALEEQEKAREILIERSKSIRSFADQLMSLVSSGVSDLSSNAVKEVMARSSAMISEERGSPILNIVGEKIPFKIEKIPSFVSIVYNRAKELESGLGSIETAKNRLMKELEILKRESETAKHKVKVKHLASREWYERYRWFLTSDGLLAVGGRDASSNSAVVRRHLTENDLVFHAEIHGSPFFVLKNAKGDGVNSINEVAQATVSFSRAWKEGIATVDAYWVSPDQVKKAAPSGQFLPKGSFVIEGKRNYIKGLELKLAIGLTATKETVKVVCGSPASIKKNCQVYVVITPDASSVSDSAKRIKAEFVKAAPVELSELAKGLSLDEIVRALPSGGCRVLRA